MRRFLQASLLFLICAAVGFSQTRIVNADIVLNSVGVAATDNFDAFLGLGFQPGVVAGFLDSDTYRATGLSEGNSSFGGTHSTAGMGDLGRGTSTGGVGEGATESGIYAFEVGGSGSGDFAVGVQPSDTDFTPGTFTIRGINNTGQTISAIQISAIGYFYSDQDRSTNWDFAFSLDDSTYSTFFDIDSPEAAETPEWDAIPISGTIPLGAGIANGQQFYIRITGSDLAGSGSRDEFALDDLSLTAVPEPSSVAILIALLIPCCRTRFRVA